MMKTVTRIPLVSLSIALLLHAALPLPLQGQMEAIRGTIAGKIYEKSSRTVLADVRVSAKSITTNELFTSGMSDARGSYLITEVPPGIYAFTIEHQGREYPVTDRMDVRVSMSFLLESCFLLDTSYQTASVLQECASELYAETQVVTIGPHRFFRTAAPQEEDVALLQSDLTIQHTAVECLAYDLFPQLAAHIQPGEAVQSSRVYFRAEQYPDFYYVEMEGTGDVFVAVLPKPSLDTERVVYYIEAVDLDFNNAQTPEADPEVSDSDTCSRRNPEAAYFQGDMPDIIVGAVTEGSPAIPLGFEATGITGFISATGVVTSVGSAAGGTAGAVGAAAVGAGAGLGATGTVLVVTGAAAATAGVATTGGTEEPEASGVQQ